MSVSLLLYSVATDCFGDKVKVLRPCLFPDIPRCSRTRGFQHWAQMDLSDESEYKLLSVGIINILQVSLTCVLSLDRMGHGIATYQPTSTWTPTSISSSPAFCSKPGRDASSSPASTQTSAQCKSTGVIANSLHFILLQATALQHYLKYILVCCRCWVTARCFFFCASLRVHQKQNKYPILFLTQGISETYPELMDIRCQTTQIAISFAQSENILVSCVVLDIYIYNRINGTLTVQLRMYSILVTEYSAILTTISQK